MLAFFSYALEMSQWDVAEEGNVIEPTGIILNATAGVSKQEISLKKKSILCSCISNNIFGKTCQ